jgi:hypothetical protein
VSRTDCPNHRDLFESLGTPSDPWSDPNEALWLSIRPPPPPSWPARLRERAASFSLPTVLTRFRDTLPQWVATRATARDWVSSTILGLAIGLGVGIGSRSIISDPAAAPLAAAPVDTRAPEAPAALPLADTERVEATEAMAPAEAIRVAEAPQPAEPLATLEPEHPMIRTVVQHVRPRPTRNAVQRARSRAARSAVQRAQPQMNMKPASRVKRAKTAKARSKASVRRARKIPD